jgi:predicted RNA-binding Zn ribbon-like protein
MPLDTLVDLVNGWGDPPRLEAGEQDCPYPPLDSMCGRLGVPADSRPRTDTALVDVANRLYPVFAASDVATRVDTVNRLLAATNIQPVLSSADGRVEASWAVADSGQAVLGAAAVALRRHLADHSGDRAVDRLGLCEGRRCADVFVDASPGGHRRFCSVTCQNRARVAAFRARRVAATARG